MYHGYTPTPTNPERIEYDLQRNEQNIANGLAYNISREYATTEAEADKLDELIDICNTDPAHILNAQIEVAPWDEIPDIVTVTMIDGTEPSPYISGGEVFYPAPYKSNAQEATESEYPF